MGSEEKKADEQEREEKKEDGDDLEWKSEQKGRQKSALISGQQISHRMEHVLGEVGPFLLATECDRLGVPVTRWKYATATMVENGLIATLSGVFGETYARSVVRKCFTDEDEDDD